MTAPAFGRTNLDRLRERYARQQTHNAGREGWWRPEKGRHEFRILPPAAGQDLWYVEYGVHYRLTDAEDGSGTVLCPRLTLQRECPACASVKALWRSARQGNKGDEALAREIGGKRRFASNVVSLKEPNTPKVYAYGVKLWEQLAELYVGDNEGIVPLDDPDRGHNLTLIIGEERTGTGTFPTYLVKPAMQPSPLADKSVLGKLHDLRAAIGNVPSAEEIKRLLSGDAPEQETGETVEPAGETDEPETGGDEEAHAQPQAASVRRKAPGVIVREIRERLAR